MVFGQFSFKEILHAPYLSLHFVTLGEFYLLRKNNVRSMENKHISYRQRVSMREFSLFVDTGIEKICIPAYLSLRFTLILQLRTSSDNLGTNYVGFMEKMYISLRHYVKLNDFFMIPHKYDMKEFLNAEYLTIAFSITL